MKMSKGLAKATSDLEDWNNLLEWKRASGIPRTTEELMKFCDAMGRMSEEIKKENARLVRFIKLKRDHPLLYILRTLAFGRHRFERGKVMNFNIDADEEPLKQQMRETIEEWQGMIDAYDDDPGSFPGMEKRRDLLAKLMQVKQEYVNGKISFEEESKREDAVMGEMIDLLDGKIPKQ